MPDKTPELVVAIYDALPGPVKSLIIASVLTLLRCYRDDKESRGARIFLEVALGGALGFFVSSVMEGFDLPPAWGGAAATAIGVYGVDQVRQWGRAIARKHITKDHEHDN